MIDSVGTIKRFTEGTLIDSIARVLAGGWGLTYGAGHLWAADPSSDMVYRVNLAPEAFSLISPSDGAPISPDTIRFDWEDSYDADSLSYSLYLSPDPAFSDTGSTIIIDSLEESEYTLTQSRGPESSGGRSRRGRLGEEETALEETGEQIAEGHVQGADEDGKGTGLLAKGGKELIPDTSYYWKVKAYDSWGDETWSNETWEISVLSCACGDCNGDARVTVADATYIVNYIYRDGSGVVCEGDVNSDGRVTVADANYIVSYVYRGGLQPCDLP